METEPNTRGSATAREDHVDLGSYQNKVPPSGCGRGHSCEKLQIGSSFDDGREKLEVCDVDLLDGSDRSRASYVGLILHNRPYRLYLASYLVTRAGDWFNYVACLSAIGNAVGKDGKSPMTAVSLLVIIRILPYIFLSSVGGALADARDRRKCMIVLDCLGSFVVLLYVVACWLGSVVLIYLVAFLQESIAALYEPSKTAIVPLLVPQEDYLKKATTLSTVAWSVMAAVGSSLGGFAVSALGVETCFVIDSVSFGASAFLMWRVGGKWTVVDTKGEMRHSPLWSQFLDMTRDGLEYLLSSSFGSYVLLKFSAALIFGSADVLNVAFSRRLKEGTGDSSERLGFLFASVGVGCLVGPVIADTLTDMKDPGSLLRACVLALALISLGYLGMGCFEPFLSVCFFTAVRSAGSAIAWVDSTLILQKFSSPEMLGRVTSVEFTLATIGEAVSALLAGILQDNCGLSPEGASFAMAALGAIMTAAWVLHLANKATYDGIDPEARTGDKCCRDKIAAKEPLASEERALLP